MSLRAFARACATRRAMPTFSRAPRAWSSDAREDGGATAAAAAAAADGGVTLTPACARRLRDVAREEGDDVALRLAVEGGGCSGFKYTFSLEKMPTARAATATNATTATTTGGEPHQGDFVFTSADGDARLVVDEISYGFVKGATIDYVEEMIKSSFEVVKNPQADASCGCGASFNAKDALFS